MSDVEKLPRKIGPYIKREAHVGEFVVIEYSKTQLMMRNFINSKTLNKKVSENLLYEVRSTSEESAFEQMKARVFLNNKIKDDFKINQENNLIKLDSSITIKNTKINQELILKLFDIYLVYDFNSNTQYFAVVSINIQQDISFLTTCLISQLLNMEKVIEKCELSDHEKGRLKKTVFTNNLIIYTTKISGIETSVKEKLINETGWEIKVKEERMLREDSIDAVEKINNTRMILCENTDAELYNSISIDNTLFISDPNSYTLFHNISTKRIEGLRDRDYLTDGERQRLLNKYPNYFILGYYCIENYLYHPDNIEDLNVADFDKEVYIKDIIQQKNQSKSEIIYSLKDSRRAYGELKFPDILNNKKPSPKDEIISCLESDDILKFYKYFDMKNKFNKKYLEELNIPRTKLSDTKWFKDKIVHLINKRV